VYKTKGLQVVENFSSKLELPLEQLESIDADHMQMTRYSSKYDQGYRDICDILKLFIGQEIESQQKASTRVPTG
jgi:hypothetical protein